MNHQQTQKHKILTLETLLPLVQSWKQDNQKIVFTNGCFDLLHPGHVDYLNKAADLGDHLIVALNTDASVQKLKGPHRPIQSEAARLQIMAGLECVSAVFLFSDDTPLEVLTEILPHTLVKGGDYTIETIVGAGLIMQNGGNVEVIPFLEGYSTSSIEKKIRLS